MKAGLRGGLMALLAFLVLLPFLWTISTSFKPLTEVNRDPPQWVSAGMSVAPYRDMFFYLPFSLYAVNSLLVASASAALRITGWASRGACSSLKASSPPIASAGNVFRPAFLPMFLYMW